MADDIKVLVGAELDLNPAIQELAKLQKQVDATKAKQKELDQTTEEGAVQYQVYGAQIRELNKQIRAKTKELDTSLKNQKDDNVVQEAANEILQTTYQNVGQLRRELRELRNEDLSILTEEEAQAVLKRIADVQTQLADTQRIIQAFDTDQTFTLLAESVTTAVASVSLLGNTLGALGVQSKVVDQIKNSATQLIASVQALNVLTTYLRKNRLALLAANLKIVASTVSETLATAALNAQLALQNVNENTSILTRARLTVVTGLLTAAQWLWNTAVAASPLGALVLTATAFIAVGTALVSLFNRESEATKEVNKRQEEYNRLKREAVVALDDLNAAEEVQIQKALLASEQRILQLKRENATDEEIKQAELDREIELSDIRQAAHTRRIEEYSRELESLRSLQAAMEAEIETTREGSNRYNELAEAIRNAAQRRAELADSINAEYFARERLATQTATQILDYEKGAKKVTKAGKGAADSAITNLNNVLTARKAFDIAMLKAEADYQKTDFATRQAYARKIQDIEYKTQLSILENNRKFKKITEDEYKQSLQILSLAQTEFLNGQISDANKYFEEQRKALLSMVEQSADEQIAAIEKRYRKALDDLSKIEPPQRLAGQSDEEYNKALQEYEQFQLAQTQLAVRLERERDKEIKAVRENFRQEQERLINAALTKEYAQQLAEADRNEERRLRLIEEGLKKEIAMRRKAGLDTFNQEAQLRENDLRLQQIALNKELLQAGDNAEQRYKIRKEYLEAELQLYDEGSIERLEIERELLDAEKELWDERYNFFTTWANQVNDLLNAVSSLFTKDVDAQVAKYAAGQEDQRKELDRRLKAGLISQSKYDEQVAELDQELEDQRRELEIQAARREKALKIFSAVTDTAAGVIKAVAASPLTFGLPYSAFVAATGAAQIAAIASQPINVAARGMYISGKSHEQGGELIEAEAGEVVINRRSVKMFGGLLSAINQAGGGVPFRGVGSDGGYFMRSLQNAQSVTADEIAQAINDNVHIYTSVEEFKQVEGKWTEAQENGQLFG